MDYLTHVDSHGSLARVSYNLMANLRHAASNISFRESKDVREIMKTRKTKKWPGRKITFVAGSFAGSLSETILRGKQGIRHTRFISLAASPLSFP